MGSSIFWTGIMAVAIGIYNFIADSDADVAERIGDVHNRHLHEPFESRVFAAIVDKIKSPIGKIIMGLALIALSYWIDSHPSYQKSVLDF